MAETPEGRGLDVLVAFCVAKGAAMLAPDRPLSSVDIDAILSRIPEARVTVFGDFCLDAYWVIDEGEEEKSVETQQPVRRVKLQRYSLGGAANVVANLLDLGVSKVFAVGVVGSELFGAELLRLLRKRGTDTSGIIVLDDPWQTMVYAKPYCRGVEGNRLDFGAFNTFSRAVIEMLIGALDQAAAMSSVVILNQQVSGGVSGPDIIAQINRVIENHRGTRFIVDARHHAALYRGAIFKLNVKEASLLVDEHVDGEAVSFDRAKSYARCVCEKAGQPVFLTRSEKGMLVADGSEVYEVPGIQIVEPTDPVGAGDTAVAALAAVLGSGGDPLAAAKFANIAASVTVRKLQTTGTASPEEIRAAGSDPDYVYSPDLADSPERARFVENTEIELVGAIPADVSIKFAIFDHDGTISTLREGWEDIMEPMMVRAVLGRHYVDADAPVFNAVINTVRNFIDKTTGIQTLAQMQGLVRMVRQFGYVPQDQILDEHGYKRLYNGQLLDMVRERVRKLKLGELDPADFQIKNAVPLLAHLHRRGVKLYLASGTDQVDVVYEANALGYAHLFEGRIYGAVGAVHVEPKKILVQRIISDNSLSRHEFVTFGDGPVEMRETHKRDGICVGVASQEIRRFGLNVAKRSRLIRAGAGFIIPDFSQWPSLLRLLHLA